MVPFYWLSQVVGAFSAALLLHVLLGDPDHLGATIPKFGVESAFGMEILLTAILVSVVLGTATRHRVLGSNAALAAGGAVALCGLFARPISGASMNPARSLAPAVLSGMTGGLWIYLTAPLIGSLLAVAAMEVVHRRKHGEEIEAASGEKK
jgi:aquaporin Z